MARALIKSDSQIQQDVLRELKFDTRVEETDVGVEVDGGIVTLTGTVSSYLARQAAQEAAHQVAGVRDVVNNVRVVPAGSGVRTDTDIARSVRETLEWHPQVPEERIQTTVSDGWVTLTGEVDRWSQSSEAERAVRPIRGVRGISNQITIKPSMVTEAAIRETIEEALERRAERQAERIQIEIHDGTVALRGTVRSWAERQSIVGAAGHAPGVRQVEDHLRTDAYM
jgi:osmotically-inducible protein OsmY